MLRALGLSIVLLAALPMALANEGRAESAEALVNSAAAEIAESEATEVADAVLSHIDATAIAYFTLGRYSGAISANDKHRFAEAFKQFLRRQIEANAHQFIGVDVAVIDTSARGARDAIVTTQVRGKGTPMQVRWRVIERDGTWSVVDLEVAGVWLAIEQRAQVAAILSRPGANIDDVIAQFG
ncbi:MAG: ABC transporter substrate-binding protein [Pseudomonadota bacterium]